MHSAGDLLVERAAVPPRPAPVDDEPQLVGRGGAQHDDDLLAARVGQVRLGTSRDVHPERRLVIPVHPGEDAPASGTQPAQAGLPRRTRGRHECAPRPTEHLDGHLETVRAREQDELIEIDVLGVSVQLQPIRREGEVGEQWSQRAVDEDRPGDAALTQLQQSAVQPGPSGARLGVDVERADVATVDPQAPGGFPFGRGGHRDELVDDGGRVLRVVRRGHGQPQTPVAFGERARGDVERFGGDARGPRRTFPVDADRDTFGGVEATQVHVGVR